MEKIIEGFPNYSITSDGEIYSLNYLGVRGRKQKLSPSPRKADGYIKITLCRDGKKYDRYLHILVAQHFIPNPDNLSQVNHKDGDKSNCHDWNLEWCTQSKNIKHAYDNGLIDRDKLNKHLDSIRQKAIDSSSKEVLQLNEDGSIYARYKNATEASKATGANRRHICSCCNGDRIRCGGWKWAYATEIGMPQ